MEDESYGPFPGNTKRFLRQSTIDAVVEAARLSLRLWFSDLAANPALLDAFPAMAWLKVRLLQSGQVKQQKPDMALS